MKIKLAIAGIVLLALTGVAHAATVTLDSGMNTVNCPTDHRAQAAYTLDRNGLRVNCVAPTGVPPQLPTATGTPSAPTLTPTASPTSPAVSSHPNCQNRPPLGAIPPATYIWCAFPLNPEVTTHVNGANSWVDEFNHGVSTARLGLGTDGYVAGKVGDQCDVVHWRHSNHWMSDTLAHTGQFPTLCAAWLRPARTFTVTDRLVIDSEVAVPIAGTRNADGLSDSWPEIVISNGQPSRLRNNGTYLYETFPGAWTFGCRLQQNRQPLCAAYNTGSNFAGSSDRIWEINQTGGQVRFQSGGGAYSSAQHAAVWKQCTSTDDPDTVCRNKFRFVFEKDAGGWVFTLYVNGFEYYRAGLLPGMDNLFAQPVFIYQGSFAYRILDGTDIRFHWDAMSIVGE